MKNSSCLGAINIDALLDYNELQKHQMRKTFKSEVLATLGSPEEVSKALMYCYRAEVEGRGLVFRERSELNSLFFRVAKWLVDPSTRPWLLLYGPVGNGKTTLLRSIQKLINSQNLKYGCYVTKMSFTSSIRLVDLSVENRQYFNEVKCLDALGIDDLGIEPIEVNDYGTLGAPIVELLLQRYETRKLTIFTSNLNFEAISNRYKERVADRLREVCDFLFIESDSYR